MSGNANCYLVKPGTTFSFDATKQGSSSSLINGNPKKARVIWESLGTSIVPNVGDVISQISYSKDIGLISITTNNTGNALVALCDSDDIILWSWHIWVTDYDPRKSYINFGYNGFVMDRNLGSVNNSTINNQNIGLFYQWGRKDPLIEQKSSKTASTVAWPSYVQSSPQTGTIEYSVQNPTTFISGNTYNKDWLFSMTESDDSRWGESKTGRYNNKLLV